MKRILKNVEITRTDGRVFKVTRAVMHENVIAFMDNDKHCHMPLYNVNFISSEFSEVFKGGLI